MSEGVCEALTFMEWSTMVVPTYPEGGSHALKVCQHHHQVVRVGRFVRLSETQRTRCSRLLRPIRLKPSRYNSAQRALLYREGGGRWAVRPHACAVFLGAEIRVMGTNSTKPFRLTYSPRPYCKSLSADASMKQAPTSRCTPLGLAPSYGSI